MLPYPWIVYELQHDCMNQQNSIGIEPSSCSFICNYPIYLQQIKIRWEQMSYFYYFVVCNTLLEFGQFFPTHPVQFRLFTITTNSNFLLNEGNSYLFPRLYHTYTLCYLPDVHSEPGTGCSLWPIWLNPGTKVYEIHQTGRHFHNNCLHLPHGLFAICRCLVEHLGNWDLVLAGWTQLSGRFNNLSEFSSYIKK